MASKTNLAYKNYIELDTRAHIGRIKKKKHSIRPSFVIVVVLVVSSLLAFLVFSMARLNEVTSAVNSLEKQYKIQQSEQVRLNAELEARLSNSNIEQYAKDRWGMQKQSSDQINYITVSKGNTIELKDDGEGMLCKFFNDVKKFFGQS